MISVRECHDDDDDDDDDGQSLAKLTCQRQCHQQCVSHSHDDDDDDYGQSLSQADLTNAVSSSKCEPLSCIYNTSGATSDRCIFAFVKVDVLFQSFNQFYFALSLLLILYLQFN